ncbi:cysteine desulfurase family protein [Asticcacaulis solisilvae]|uniref:cysteine desulfurase family protein n=1 Tax=Asticcacaulis solisilvae TaxID=1217274 RepID=UPI003FD78BDC
MTVYLDHAATSPLRPEAREAFLRVAEAGGNASSVHGVGRKAKIAVEDARAGMLGALNATGQAGLVFTSGGTEANALALHQARDFDYVVVSKGEHDSVFTGVGVLGRPVETVALTADGQADLEALADILAGTEGRPFVALMLANNETGVVSDIARAAAIVAKHQGWLHVDAVQALGKIDIDVSSLGAQSLSLSAHKVGGGQGVGALVYERDRVIKPGLVGGGQELGLRAGTENVPGIAAFAAAVQACQGVDEAVSRAQSAVEASLAGLGVTILGADAPRVPGILAIVQPHWASNLQLIQMDMAGICVSSGSACSSGKVKASRVVAAMGLADMADKVLRVSSGWTTTADDWERFYAVWSKGYETYLERHGKAPVKEQA